MSGLAAAAMALSSAVMAEDAPGPNLDPLATGPAGGVAQLVLAQDLYAIGLARGEPIVVLAAARLALGVEVTDVARVPEPQPEPQPQPAPEPQPGSEQDPAAADLARPARAEDMLATARVLAGEDVTLAGLVDEAEAEAAGEGTAAASRTASALAPGQAETWRVAFFGETPAEVAVAGGAPVSLAVADENGHPVCTLPMPAGSQACRFVPAANGYFTVTVTNPGAAPLVYDLLTN